MTDRRQKEQEADLLFSRLIRSRGFCQAQGFITIRSGVMDCWGTLQCAHIMRRRFKSSALRWDPDNAASLCMRHHIYLDENRPEMERFAAMILSPARLEELQARAHRELYARPDMDEVLMYLRRTLGERV